MDIELFERSASVRLAGVDAGYDNAAVLTGIDFEARAGEVALVSGAAASGKTTLIHLMRLALPPRNGRATILGADALSAPPSQRAAIKRRIGYIAENPLFIEEISTFENIALPLHESGRKRNDYGRDVQELVDYVGLSSAARAPASQLSAAQRRFAAAARALAARPDLIVADEPVAAMNDADAQRLVRLLAEMRRVGACVVIASKDESLARWAPMRHWRIEQGRLYEASPQPATGARA